MNQNSNHHNMYSTGSVRKSRSRWAAIGAAIAVTVGAGGLSLVDAAGSGASSFVPISPCRLIDTRGNPDRVGPHGSLGSGDQRTVDARGQVGDCVIPSIATALSLNATALGATQPTFVTIWPDGALPKASSLNPAPGQPPTPNAVVVPLSATGSFEMYNLAGAVDMIIDVNGFYVDAGVEQLAQQLDALATKVSQLEQAEVDGAERISRLEVSKPFVKSVEPANVNVGAETTTVAAVTVTAPVLGNVTLNSSITIHESLAGAGLGCSISTGSEMETDKMHVQQTSGFPENHASMSGTRSFSIDIGETVTYRLNCVNPLDDIATAINPMLTAIFTPAHLDAP